MTDDGSFAVGLMSGTSADGIEAVVIRSDATQGIRVIGHHSAQYPRELQQKLVALSHEAAPCTMRDFAMLDADIGKRMAAATRSVLLTAQVSADQVAVIGMHGPTLFHAPPDNSVQIGNPNVITAATGIPVVTDLRRADIALGGQGAPLVPMFHAMRFGAAEEGRAVINIGGIANITGLPASGNISGYDTGPGNALMDEWCQTHRKVAYDDNGQWARSGNVIPSLLQAWLDDPYYMALPPKSSGRGQINIAALFSRAQPEARARPEDIQRTLLELTAQTIADAVFAMPQPPSNVYICGGGARNGLLKERLTAMLDPIALHITDDVGIAVDQVEAAAFAWLALRRLRGQPNTLASVTGAACNAVGGALYLSPRGSASPTG